MTNKTIQNAINVAKDYISKEMPWMEDADYSVRKNTPSTANIVSKSLFGNDSEHVPEDEYYTVSFTKNIQTEEGFNLSKELRILMKNNEIEDIIESK